MKIPRRITRAFVCISVLSPVMARGADLPSRLPPPPPPVLELVVPVEKAWAPSGFFASVFAGAGFNGLDDRFVGKNVYCLDQYCDSQPPSYDHFKVSTKTLSATLEAGFDVQVDSSIFAGVALDASFYDHQSQNAYVYNGAFTDPGVKAAQIAVQIPYVPQPYRSAVSTSLTSNWLVSARARLGFSPVDDLDLYVTGGPALVDVSATTTASASSVGYYSGALSGSSKTPVFGYVYGVGIDYAFAKRWSFALEYLRATASKSYAVTKQYCNCMSPTDPAPFSANAKVSFNFLRAGIRYRF